jgi:hypothetical protein
MEAESWRSEFLTNLGRHVEEMWNGDRVKDDTTAVSVRWLGPPSVVTAGKAVRPGETTLTKLTG